jgi:hypothetical protein
VIVQDFPAAEQLPSQVVLPHCTLVQLSLPPHSLFTPNRVALTVKSLPQATPVSKTNATGTSKTDFRIRASFGKKLEEIKAPDNPPVCEALHANWPIYFRAISFGDSTDQRPFGTKRTCQSCRSMSAFGGKADMASRRRDVCL